MIISLGKTFHGAVLILFRLCLASQLTCQASMVDHGEIAPVSLTPDSSFKEVFLQLKNRPRDEIDDWLKSHLETMRGAEWETYLTARVAEMFHVAHVRRVMEEAGMVSVNPQGHDFTKDEWYWFITIGRFTMGQKDLVADVFRVLTNQHYKAEPHHEEFEKLNNKECLPAAIAEMAVDRLSRNLQMNGGVYNWEQLQRYEPEFFLGDTAGKLELYKTSVRNVEHLTKTVWDRMKAEQQVESSSEVHVMSQI